MRILVAVVSCRADRSRHHPAYDTWLRHLPKDVDYKFFVGGGDPENWAPDEILVSAPDSYEYLSTKTKALCSWANAQGYDYVFKCDTDTVVNVDRLLSSGFEQHDYMGGSNEDNVPANAEFWYPRIQFASGGAGYWLSQKAMVEVAKGWGPTFPAEDVYVACKLKKAGILPVWCDGYRWRPIDQVEGATTFHLSSGLQKKYSPELMYECYQRISA